MKKAAVLGSFVVDLMALSPKLPASGETVKGRMFRMGPGGKGFNQAIAAGRAGVKISYVTKLGNDEFARIATGMLEKESNVDFSQIIYTDDAPTGAALITVDERTGENDIVVVTGSCDTFNDDDIEKLDRMLSSIDYLLLQLEINMDALEKIIRSAYGKGVKVILNPAPAAVLNDEIYGMLYLITPNESEAETLTSIRCDTAQGLDQAASWFLEKGVENVVITLGRNGSYLSNKEGKERFDNYDVEVVDTTGAGDAYNGGLLAGLCTEMTIADACRYASAVSNLAVTKIGTSIAMPYENEIEKLLAMK